MKATFTKIQSFSQRTSKHFRRFIEHNANWMIALLITTLSLLCRYLVAPYPTNDMVGFILNGWMKGIDTVGFSKFYTINSDYSPLYLFFIAVLSLLPKGNNVTINGYTYDLNRMYYVKSFYFLVDILMAVGVYLLLRHITKDKFKATIGYCITLCLPIQLVNSALWGNCDCLYFTCFLYVIYAILKKKSHLAWFFFGLSLSLKMQSVFILPFLVYLMLNGKLKFYPIYMAVVALFLSFLPSYICGAAFREPFRYFYEQVGGYSMLTLGCANFWKFFSAVNRDNPSSPLNQASIYIGLLLIGLFTAIVYLRRVKLTDRNIVLVSVFLIGIVPYFLPHMHERYFYSLDVLTILYALLHTEKKRYFIIPLMQVSSAIAYYHYLSGSTNIYIFDILKEDCVTIASIINLFLLTLIFTDIMKFDQQEEEDNSDILTNHLSH